MSAFKMRRLRQVCQAGREGHGLVVQLRSDLEELSSIPVQVRVPTVWLLGSSTAATRRLMAGIVQQPPSAKEATATHMTPAEVFVDGVKWCNLLAAPVTTPALALSALAYALPPNPSPEANSQRTGPLRMANQALMVSSQAFQLSDYLTYSCSNAPQTVLRDETLFEEGYLILMDQQYVTSQLTAFDITKSSKSFASC